MDYSNTQETQNMLATEQIVMLPVDLIVHNPDNDKIFTMDGLDSLANSIKDDGFTGAIEVIKTDNGTYEIVSGHRRYEATKLAGNKTIPAIILPPMDETMKAKKLITSNIFNREMTSMDKARAIEYYIYKVLKADPSYSGNTQQDVAKFFNISVTQVKYLRRMLKFIPELQDLVAKNYVTYTALIDASQFTKDEQYQLYNDLIDIINDEIKLRDENPDTKNTPFSTLQNSRVVKVIETIKHIRLQKEKQQKEILTDGTESAENSIADVWEKKNDILETIVRRNVEDRVVDLYRIQDEDEDEVEYEYVQGVEDKNNNLKMPADKIISQYSDAVYNKEVEQCLKNGISNLQYAIVHGAGNIPNLDKIIRQLEHQIVALKQQKRDAYKNNEVIN